MGTSDHKEGVKTARQAQPNRSALDFKPLPLAGFPGCLLGESRYSWPSSPRGTGSLHQILLGDKTTLRNFTSINSLTLMDVYEEDTLGDTDLQI